MLRNTATFWSSSTEGKKTRIILVRHGRVAWNARSAYTGWTDIPLDEQGIKQAAVVAERLRKVNLDAVYSSDLVRAVRTAEIIAEPHGLQVTTLSDLREINYGEWEGLEVQQIIEKYGQKTLNDWARSPETYQIPGGETFGQLRDRIVPAVKHIAKAHPGKTVAIVAHKSVNRVLICSWLGLEVGRYKQIEQDNCAINSALFDGNRVVLETVNDVCHAAKFAGHGQD